MFDESKLYPTNDPALKSLAAPSTFAHWRAQGRGPHYIKIGGRVAYAGAALNQWLVDRTVQPAAA